MSDIFKIIPMQADALAAFWGKDWLRPATHREAEAWQDEAGPDYLRFARLHPEMSIWHDWTTAMVILRSAPENVIRFFSGECWPSALECRPCDPWGRELWDSTPFDRTTTAIGGAR